MLCSCPGPDELTYLTQGLCARPRLVLLVLLVPAAGKLTPSNVGKLTPCRSTLCVLANAHPLGLTLGSDWEGKSRGAGDSPKCALSSLPEPRSPKPQDPTRTPLPPPQPPAPVLRAAELESSVGSSLLPSARVWSSGLEAGGRPPDFPRRR